MNDAADRRRTLSFGMKDAFFAARINTVTVIERAGPASVTVHCFPDTEEGNAQAEALFRHVALQQEMGEPTSGIPLFHEVDLDAGIEDGYLSRDRGEWELFLVHSEGGTAKEGAQS